MKGNAIWETEWYKFTKDKILVRVFTDSVTLLGEFFQKIKRSTCFLCYNVITNKTYT